MNVVLFFLGLVASGLVAFWLLEKYARGWRTVVLNLLQGIPLVGGMIVELLEAYPVSETIPAKYMLAYLGGVIVLNVIYRIGTNSPLGARGAHEPEWDVR